MVIPPFTKLNISEYLSYLYLINYNSYIVKGFTIHFIMNAEW